MGFVVIVKDGKSVSNVRFTCTLALEKIVPVECLLKDQVVAKLFIENKMQWVFTHALLRAFVVQMQSICPDVLQKLVLRLEVQA